MSQGEEATVAQLRERFERIAADYFSALGRGSERRTEALVQRVDALVVEMRALHVAREVLTPLLADARVSMRFAAASLLAVDEPDLAGPVLAELAASSDSLIASGASVALSKLHR